MFADHSRRGCWNVVAACLFLAMSVAGPAAAADSGGTPSPVSLLVVGPDGDPVPGIDVEIRTRPVLAAEHVRRGRFREAGPYGATVTAEPTDHFFGERQYTVLDHIRRTWVFTQSIADVAPQEWGATVPELPDLPA